VGRTAKNYFISRVKLMRFLLDLETLIRVFPAKHGEKHIYFGMNKWSNKLGCVNLTIRSFSSSKIKESFVFIENSCPLCHFTHEADEILPQPLNSHWSVSS
jgi:hypothetical protein